MRYGSTALDYGFAVVTTNARDFIELLDVDVHPGRIEHVKDSGDEDFLLNHLIEISGVGRFEVRDIP